MTKWRPTNYIRFKALGLHWRANAVLAAEVPNDAGEIKGVRPLGGTVLFGESASDAVIREFHEELGLAITLLGDPFFMENIYAHEGSLGHEVLAIYDVAFPEDAYADQTRIEFHEDNGTKCVARWFDLQTLDVPSRPRLFPQGLKARLLARR